METAVVIGSGIAGLAAAAALSGHGRRVVVIERDEPPGSDVARSGAPQGAQLHVLLQAGADALEALLPGTRAEIAARGGAPIDFGADLAWRHFGRWKTRTTTGFGSHPLTRPELEGILRRRVEALPDVEIRYATRCEGLHIEGGRVRGILAVGPAGEAAAQAELVVDASGRASKLPRWLDDAGYPMPDEERVQLGLLYTCGRFEADAAPPWRALLLSPDAPAGRRGAALQRRADGTYFGGVWGYHGDHPPTDFEGVREFARGLGSDELHRFLLGARPLGPLRSFGVPYQRWLHLERAARFPSGLLPIGDVVCSFDPVYGQGMSVAATEALLLGRLLARGLSGDALRRAWFAGCARIIATPWSMATSEAFRFSETTGPRPFGLALLHPFVRAVARLGETDVDAYRAFLRVMHLLDSPATLFHPRILWGLLRAAAAGRQGRRSGRREGT